jgi:hypothetical protein
MYFDHCATPAELRKAIGDLLRVVTYTVAAPRGPTIIPIVGPLEDQTFRQAVLEAISVAQRLRKESPELPPLPDITCLPLEGLMRISAWCDRADWRTGLQEDETSFLLASGRSVEMIVAGPKNSKAMEQFRSQLVWFWDRWQAYRKAHDAWKGGTWTGEMGEPPNPLGAIWAWAYGTGWERPERQGAGRLPIPMSDYAATLPGDYVLLAVIHDMVLPDCPRINDGHLPDELTGEIRNNVLDDPQREGGLSHAREHIISEGLVEGALKSVKQDLKSEQEHGSGDKADQRGDEQRQRSDGTGHDSDADSTGAQERAGGFVMDEQTAHELSERIAAALEDWADPKNNEGLRHEYVGHERPIRIALTGFDELLRWLRSARPDMAGHIEALYDSLIEKARLDDHLLDTLYETDTVHSEDAALGLATGLRAIWTVDEVPFDETLVDEPKTTGPGQSGGTAGATEPSEKLRYVFKNEGATWRIIYGECETTVKDSKGVQYIHYLVKNSNTSMECLDIERACSNAAAQDVKIVDSEEALDAGLRPSGYDLKQLDGWDVKDIKKAIDNLKGSVEDTDDPCRKAELQKEISVFREYLGKNVNIHGQGRPVGEVEKSRKRVSNAINRAKQSITSHNKDVGAHFESAIRAEQTAFVYKPDRKIDWTLS